MSTTKQIVANRGNARQSTGPVTKAGRALVAKNAIKHGILSSEVLLEEECKVTLNGFSERMREALLPIGEVEELLVDRIVASAWRLKRLIKVEAAIFRQEMEVMFGSGGDLGLAFIRDGNGADAFSKLSRYEAGIERGIYRALHELQRLQAVRVGKEVPLPVVVELVGPNETAPT
jgi:hypothetical protein